MEKEILVEFMQKASVIACTTYMAGSTFVSQAVSNDLVGIIIDDASHEKDENLLPLFAMRLPNYTFMAMIGDAKQLAPPMLLDAKASVFIKELHLPCHGRLQLAGFNCSNFFHQSRSLTDIADAISLLSDGGKITHSDTSSLATRPAARYFRSWCLRHFGVKSNIIFLDHVKRTLNRVDTSEGQSKSCPLQLQSSSTRWIFFVGANKKMMDSGGNVTGKHKPAYPNCAYYNPGQSVAQT